jgi:hypothetical protein
MLDDDALVARQPWDWSELVVEEFFPAVTAPNTVYIARCRVVCRPWIIHEVAILNTAGGLRVSLPDRVYLSRGQIALTDDGKPRRIAVISMLDADDWNGFSDAVIEAVQAGWGPLGKSRRQRRQRATCSREQVSNPDSDAADAAVEMEMGLPSRYLP